MPPESLSRVIVVTGHYGSGKTNFALNLAVTLRGRGQAVAIADLDIVNPYFRTADYRRELESLGIEVIASPYAGRQSSLDIPALTARLDAGIGGERTLIVDVGGDDAGAVALGRYAPRLEAAGYSMLCVVNTYRYLDRDPGESIALLREMERVSRLQATHIVNNANLGGETTPDDIRSGLPYARDVARLAGLPLLCTTCPRHLAEKLKTIQDLYPVEIYVTAPWNAAP